MFLGASVHPYVQSFIAFCCGIKGSCLSDTTTTYILLRYYTTTVLLVITGVKLYDEELLSQLLFSAKNLRKRSSSREEQPPTTTTTTCWSRFEKRQCSSFPDPCTTSTAAQQRAIVFSWVIMVWPFLSLLCSLLLFVSLVHASCKVSLPDETMWTQIVLSWPILL